MHESYVARTVAEGDCGFGVLLYPYSQPTLLQRIIFSCVLKMRFLLMNNFIYQYINLLIFNISAHYIADVSSIHQHIHRAT